MEKLSKYELEKKIKELRSYISSDFCKSVNEAKFCYQQIEKYQLLLENYINQSSSQK